MKRKLLICYTLILTAGLCPVKAQPAADAWLDMFVSPSAVNFCPATLPITVDVYNNSLDDINTIELGWTINGAPQLPITYSSLIGPGLNLPVQLDPGFDFEAFQLYDIQVYVNLVNGLPDIDASNDTILVQFAPYDTPVPMFYFDGCGLELLNFTDYDSIIWLFNGTPDPLAPDYFYYSPIQAGNYSVIGITSIGCEAIIDSTIPVNPPSHQITALGLTSFCEGDSIQLTYSASVPLFGVTWSNSSTADTTYASSDGWFYFTATTLSGCTINDSILIIVHPLPVVAITSVNDTLVSNYSGLHQWYYNGSAISGAQDSTYVPTQQGTYYVSVTDVYGCVGVSDSIVWIMPGISALSSQVVIQVYPNPAKDFLHISLNKDSGEIRFTLCNAVGQVVKSEIITGDTVIGIEDLKPGVYIFMFASNSKTYSGKIVKTF